MINILLCWKAKGHLYWKQLWRSLTIGSGGHWETELRMIPVIVWGANFGHFHSFTYASRMTEWPETQGAYPRAPGLLFCGLFHSFDIFLFLSSIGHTNPFPSQYSTAYLSSYFSCFPQNTDSELSKPMSPQLQFLRPTLFWFLRLDWLTFHAYHTALSMHPSKDIMTDPVSWLLQIVLK